MHRKLRREGQVFRFEMGQISDVTLAWFSPEKCRHAYLAEVIDLQTFERSRASLQRQQESLMVRERELAASAQKQLDLSAIATSIEEFCAQVQTGLVNATFDQRRALVELLIDRVIVTDGEVEIHYVIPTSPASVQIRFCHLRKIYHEPVLSCSLQRATNER